MNASWETRSVSELSDRIWHALSSATEPGPDPWRTPVLATVGTGGPSVRTVVLRAFTRPGFELIAFSDARAGKILELDRNPTAAWLFYDPTARVQLRVATRMRLHWRDAVAQTYWHRLPEDQRARYRSLAAPGTPRPDPGESGATGFGDESQFAVLIGEMEELDWLWLGPSHHRRARFRRSESDWSGYWVEP
ncbi:MAG: pyridoxamine 5'-phosphate oxidase family protein [Verrucomicrobiales bacterium]|nr:pyridoxamine 5'-phosphate oxidase family protein [Verrucomicrobiales bacterium]